MDKNKDINEINESLKLLKEKRNTLQKEARYAASQQYRKDRARRLIETGALAEKYFEISNLSLEEREELFQVFQSFILANKPLKFKK